MIMLPGNPVSAFVSFEAFVRPVIRKLIGARPYVRTVVKCQAGHDLKSIPGRLQLARGIMRAHGGDVAAVDDDESPSGTRVVLTLPGRAGQ